MPASATPIKEIGADATKRLNPGHAAERAFALKGPRSAKMRNPAESKLGAKLEEVD